jgi:heavy metal sensor kinase
MRVRGLVVAVFEGPHQVASSMRIEDAGLTALAALSAGSGRRERLDAVALRDGRWMRAETAPVELDGRKFILLAAEGLAPIANDLKLVRGVLFLALPLVVLVVGAGGFLLATRSLAPVRRMAEQAQRITSKDLRKGLDAGAVGAELQLLAGSFNELLTRLDRSFDTIRRFVGDASHELRTPLAVIQGEADVALAGDRTPAEYRETIAIIQDETRRLSRLVDDLLHLARADSENVKPHREPFYLNDLLAECCRSAQTLAASRGVALDCRSVQDVTFHGDPELLRRLTSNLLDNAIRYTPAGGKVSVGLETDADGVRIAVSDTGIGISPEAAAHVFERFYRADQARSREQGGFGLGLSIVKWIAESHNGTVELHSQPGVGSTFTVLLHG